MLCSRSAAPCSQHPRLIFAPSARCFLRLTKFSVQQQSCPVSGGNGARLAHCRARRLHSARSVTKFEGSRKQKLVRRRTTKTDWDSESTIMAVMTKQGQVTSQADIDLTIHASHWNPFTVLGLHEIPGGTDDRLKEWVIRAFLPEARPAWVVDLLRGEPGELVPMERLHPDGLFQAVFSDRAEPFMYRLKIESHNGH